MSCPWTASGSQGTGGALRIPAATESSGGDVFVQRAERLEDPGRLLGPPGDRPSEDLGAHRCEPVGEAGHHAEVAAPAAQGPEQIGVLGLGRADDARVGGHHVEGDDAVAGPAEAAGQVPEPAAQGEPGDAGRGDESQRRRKAVELGLAIHVAQEAAGLRPREPGRRIHPDATHQRHVEHHRAVGDREAGDVVAASLDRERQPMLAHELHRGDDVSHAETADHQRGAAIDHGVPEAASVVVAWITGAEERAAQTRAQGGDRGGVEGVLDWSGVGSAWGQRGSLDQSWPGSGRREGANIGPGTRPRQPNPSAGWQRRLERQAESVGRPNPKPDHDHEHDISTHSADSASGLVPGRDERRAGSRVTRRRRRPFVRRPRRDQFHRCRGGHAGAPSTDSSRPPPR